MPRNSNEPGESPLLEYRHIPLEGSEKSQEDTSIMHWVYRGPEPTRLGPIRASYTLRWVQHYRQNIGNRPNDSYWQDFHEDLSKVFGGLCGYCEKRPRGTVDHFRPKSLYPEQVYSWSNWIFACNDCNQAKSNKWPVGGYVDPCAKSSPAHAERYFIFDTQTGEILPKEDLSPRRRHKAQRTIDDLKLNEQHHLKNRLEWLWMLSGIFPDDPDSKDTEFEKYRVHFASRTTPYSGIARAWLSERGHQIDA